MDFSLTDEQRSLQREITKFAKSNLNEGILERDKTASFDRALWNKCGELKLPGLAIPAEHGGRGLDALSTAIGLEALGKGCEDNGLSFSIAAHLLACTVPVWKFGSDKLKEKYLPGMCNGVLICANSISEPGAGSDTNSMSTYATKVDGGYRINGNKIFISSGPVSDISLLYAKTDKEKGYFGGISAFIVESGTPGFKIDLRLNKLGMRTAPLGEQVLEDVFVPGENMVGEAGGGGLIFNYSMDWERACLGAAHIGAMQRVTDVMVKWVKKQEFEGEPLGKQQMVSHKLANMKVQLEASRLLCYKAAYQLDNSKLAGLDASISKLYVSEAMNKIMQEALNIMGLAGYNEESGLPRHIRDAVSSTIYSGTSEIQRNIIARWMGI